MSLKHIKAGMEVFVVWQQSRHDRRNGVKPRTELVEVERVGRAYGYIKRYGSEKPFDLETGHSHHKESNERANGFGFDVYETREEYERELHATERLNLLTKRLIRGHGSLIDLPPDAVESIHLILDALDQLKTD